MAPTLSFTHASGLHAVVQSLAALHRETLRTATDALGVRMSVANLVTAGIEPASVDQAEQVLTTIGERHPARVIVILADPERAPLIEADLSLQSRPGSDEVCTEVIRLTVQGEPALHLASIVIPLLVPDIPLHLWLAGAPRLVQAFNPDTVAMCDRIILDSGRYPEPGITLAQLALELQHHGDALSLADIAWVRMQSWRELSAQAFDSAQTRPWLRDISSVEIETAGSAPSAQGWLMAGWLTRCLGWDEPQRQRISCLARAHAGVDANDLVAVRYHCRVEAQTAMVSLERTGRTLRTEIAIEDGGSTSRSVVLPELNDVALVGGLIADTARDPAYAEVVAVAGSLAASVQ